MKDRATDSLIELRQILHEIYDATIAKTRNKLIICTIHGWQASMWVEDMQVRPFMKVEPSQTVNARMTNSICDRTIRWEMVNKSLKAYMDAPGFTGSHWVDLASPNSITEMASWTKDALEFALRDIKFPK